MASILRSIGIKKPKHKKLSEELSLDPSKEDVEIDNEMGNSSVTAAGGDTVGGSGGGAEASGAETTFYCKYLGCTPIEQSSNVKLMTSAIRQILEMSKAKGKKLPNIALQINAKGISALKIEASQSKRMPVICTPDELCRKSARAKSVNESTVNQSDHHHDNHNHLHNICATDSDSKRKSMGNSIVTNKREFSFTNGVKLNRRSSSLDSFSADGDQGRLFSISIYRISYCSADATYGRVVAFVATNRNGSHECHAFSTEKHKIAQSIALSISHAFNVAYFRWQEFQKSQRATSAAAAAVDGVSPIVSSSDDTSDLRSSGSGCSSPTSSDEGPSSNANSLMNEFFVDQEKRPRFSWNVPMVETQGSGLNLVPKSPEDVDIKRLLKSLPAKKSSSNRANNNCSLLINLDTEIEDTHQSLSPNLWPDESDSKENFQHFSNHNNNNNNHSHNPFA